MRVSVLLGICTESVRRGPVSVYSKLEEVNMISSTSFKILAFAAVACAGALAWFGGSGLRNTVAAPPAVTDNPYSAPVMIGRIETSEITESSGLSASECQDVLWTHNDAGNGAFIYAMDTRGRHLGTWRVEGARSVDWESIATYKDANGKCFVLVGDIGDNDEKRRELQIYRVPEPAMTPEGAKSSSAAPLVTAAAEILSYTYADGTNNAETLLVHPRSGDIYVVTKEKSGPAGVHRIKPVFGSTEVQKTDRVAEISVPSSPKGLITGGSFSPDGSRLMLCDVKGGYEFVLPEAAANPDEIWRQSPTPVDVGKRQQGEGVSYGRDRMTLYASSEKRNAPLYMIKRRS